MRSSRAMPSALLLTSCCVLQPLDEQERTLFRFLRDRKMNVTAAADMLQSKSPMYA